MADDSNAASGNIARFQDLLRELFQFDCADLDFGIYRIMNHKRDAIERFITEKLPAAISTELEQGALEQQAGAAAALEEATRDLLAALGETAFDANGELAEAWREVPVGRAYLEAKARAGASRSGGAVADSVYNHLYTFFSRYYDEGDFISQRRYSRSQRYAIPYNGEEVHLHWANSDQYYVKTDEHFRNYDWVAPNGVSVHFRLWNADVEQNNVKGDRRFFLPLPDGIEWDAAARAVTVPFEYRPLTGAEKTRYGSQGQQDKIIARAVETIPGLLGDAPEAIGALIAEHRRNGNGPVSRLQHHLVRYTRRNNSDFFIHKDLHGFLNRELDFYLKNEVLNLDEVASAGESMADGWFQQMRLIKAAGGKVIDFLSQIEGFQKMLWEKRKFVTETQYCITLGNIGPDFCAGIAANDAQWAEWRGLFNVDSSDRSAAFLQAHPTLVLDTGHFDADFTDRLLASFDNLDGATNGLLVDSENWQALNLIREKYSGQVRCTYIDPPFNTDASQFMFKDTYQNSTWLSLLHDRLQAGRQFCTDDGSLYLHLDHNSNYYGRLLINRVFGQACLLNEVVWRIGWVSGYKTAANRYVRNHETIFVAGRRPQPYFNKNKARIPTRTFEERTIAKELTSIKTIWGLDRIGPLRLKLVLKDTEDNVYKTGLNENDGAYNIEDTWNSNEYEDLHSNKIKRNAAEYTPNGSEITQKPEQLLRRVIEVSSEIGDTVMDFFAGSGTTPAVAQKLNRKYLAIEMGQYFDTDMLWRMKQVLSGYEVGISKQTAYRGGGVFKYIRLESYEDALNSIAFDDAAGQMRLAEESDEYLLKYMLRWETKASETLLSAAELTSPFAYRLRIHADGEKQERAVDVPETFNYLLGLNVRTRRTYDDGGRRYLVYRGETRAEPGREVAVIWRETAGWAEDDFKRDRAFVAEQGLATGADVVYVNGDSAIPNARAVEPLFKARMFAGVNPG